MLCIKIFTSSFAAVSFVNFLNFVNFVQVLTLTWLLADESLYTNGQRRYAAGMSLCVFVKSLKMKYS